MDVADPDQARQILSGYPHYGPGAPVLWPQQQFIPIYHNRGEWPFVTAYWLRAAAHAGHDAVGARMIRALIRGAALNLSNMENFDAGSGAPWVDEGETSGPVVNSQRQLWSVAAYVSMVHQVIFGLQPEPAGLRVRPFMPAEIRAEIFGQTNALVLNDYPFRGRGLDIILHLPESAGTGVLGVGEIRVNGEAIDGDVIDGDLLMDGATIDIDLLAGATAPTTLTTRSDADYRDIFGPRNPWITELKSVDGKLRLTLDVAGENPADLSPCGSSATARSSPTSSRGTPRPGSTPRATQTPRARPATRSRPPTPAATTRSTPRPPAGGAPGNAHIASFGAAEMTALGGNPSDKWGRFHYEGWGAPEHTLTLPSFTPSQGGRHLFQVLFGNGSGSINTGITCGVKRLRVQRVADNVVVGEGVLIMPHLGTWDRWEDSNLIGVELKAGVEYRVVILEDADTVNMSSFQHFEIYTGGLGGVGGVHNHINIAELRVLAKP
jgi:hypothetical protein